MKEFVRHEKLMGSHFTLGLMATDASQAEKFLQEGIDIILHLDKLLYEFTVDSETTKFNQYLTTEKIMLDPICFQLMQRCANLSKLCSGDFDITIGALKKLYQFKKSDFKIPEEAAIKEALKAVGYEKIGFNKDGSVYKKTSRFVYKFCCCGQGICG